MGDKIATEEGSDYDPYKERHPEHPTNDIESMIHIIKAILGTGILAMPEAFKNSGLILGFVGCILNAFLYCYGVHIIVQSTYMLCKRNRVPLLTYTEAMRTGFAQGTPWSQKMSGAAGTVTDIFIIIFHTGACCVYVLFVVLNVKSVGDIHMEKQFSLHMYLVFLVIPFVLINSVRNLKMLVPFSIAANIVTFFTIGAVFYYIFVTPLPKLSERPLYTDLRRFPLIFGTTGFAFQSIGIVMAVENNMKTPQHFGGYFGIYNRALLLLMVLYISMGFLGFWKFGEFTKASITLNFPPDEVFTQTVNLLYALAIFLSYSLQSIVPTHIIWENYLSRGIDAWPNTWKYFLRIAIVAISFFFAASIPMLGLFMSMFGAITLSHLTFIFPGFLDICVRYPSNYGRFQVYKWRDILFISYGVFGLISGCYAGIYELVMEFIETK